MSLLYLLLAYLIGAVPTGYLWARYLQGLDIRTVGSGNIGATNILRTFGWRAGLTVLAADMAKGALVVGPLATWTAVPGGSWLAAAGGLVAVLGHDYTVFLGWKGGKGVATSCGVLLVLAPRSTLLTMGLVAVLVRLTRMVSVGSLSGALGLPVFLWLLGESEPPILSLVLLLSFFIWVKHIPNIRRIVSGTENKISSGRGRDGESRGEVSTHEEAGGKVDETR